VLRDVDLSLARGEMVGLLGPNGSGKTTLLLALTGVLVPSAGTIEIDGEPLAELAPRARARRLAAVPQRAEVSFGLRVRSIVLMGRYPYASVLGGYTAEDEAAAEQAMRETGTEYLAEREATALSGGELARVLIARALAQAADVLLLDEASASLDIARKVEVHDLLAAKNRAGATVLSAVHDLNLAALYCNRLVFLKDGRVALDGPTGTVFTAENLSRIYETEVRVFAHPDSGAPQALLVPGRDARPAAGR
jgi:iron complex transport system ATP-binding protein